MRQTITVDPVTRIEGHLKVETIIENKKVKEARCSGTLFRGLELILRGRDPCDAQVITQRICGVCPQSHGIAAVLALDHAAGIEPPPNGKLIRNLIQGAHQLSDHILHFYHLAALDYVDITQAASYTGSQPELQTMSRFLAAGEWAPFAPRDEGDYRLSLKENQEVAAHYVKALEVRRRGHEMVAIFGGKIPHSVGVVPGGVTAAPTTDKIIAYWWHLQELQKFINEVYLPDVITLARAYPDYLEMGKGCGNFLSYGAYPGQNGEKLFRSGTTSKDLGFQPLNIEKISESVQNAWYEEAPLRHPENGETIPAEEKENAYSWVKAPRYEGKVYEVGPLARVLVNYASGELTTRTLLEAALKELKVSPQALLSVMGRHLSRALCAQIIAQALPHWLFALQPGEPWVSPYQVPETGQGIGLTEAARGALGHWLKVKEKSIANYQCIVPTTWNASPRDETGNPGPLEQALVGLKVRDLEHPLEIARVIRAFDPCLACAVHCLTPKGETKVKFQI